jgi:hypothetical protein
VDTETTKQVGQVYDHLKAVQETRQFGQREHEYVETCMKSRDFRVQARLSPLLRAALEVGAVTPVFAKQKMTEMKSRARDVDEVEFWRSREEEFEQLIRK